MNKIHNHNRSSKVPRRKGQSSAPDDGLAFITKICANLNLKWDPELALLVFLDLRKSGINLKWISTLGLRVHTAAETKKLVNFNCPSYSFPYRDLNGKPMTFRADGKVQPFARYKLLHMYENVRPSNWLAPPVSGGFYRLDKKPPPKYMQAKRSGTHLYFPPLPPKAMGGMGWPEIAKNAAVNLVFTEGEKKAIAGILGLGIPTIALPGVNSINQKDLDLINLQERNATIAFDTDRAPRYRVRFAEYELGHNLLERGANVYVVHLPVYDGLPIDDDDDAIDAIQAARAADAPINAARGEGEDDGDDDDDDDEEDKDGGDEE